MGLFLPVLLLGLTQPVDQPVAPATAQPQVQTHANVASAPSTANDEAQRKNSPLQPFDRIEPYLRDDCQGDANCKVVEGPQRCLTMRSYYFERRDDLAPEFKGMTTCESAREVRERNARKRQMPRLVPATGDNRQ